MRNIIVVVISLCMILPGISCTEEVTYVGTVQHIIPKPISAIKDSGSFILTPQTKIYISDTSETMRRLAAFAGQILHIDATAISFNSKDGTLPKGIFLNLTLSNPKLGKEGYALKVDSNRIVIQGRQPAGIYYGMQTLRQLLPDETEKNDFKLLQLNIPACTIDDQPVYAYRGAMLDVARHFFTPAEVKRFIDLLAFYKMNVLHLHLTDDQGWRIEIIKWPDLTKIGGSSAVDGDKGGYYTQEEFIDLVRYAEQRFITIIPEIDMPGHTNAALASYPILNCDDKAKKLYTGIEVGFSSLCVHKDITYAFAEDVIRELADMTSGPWIHIGGDESHATSEEDYKIFIEKIIPIVHKYRKQVVGWSEIGKAKISNTTLVQFWDHDSNAVAAARQGAKIIMSPAKKIYLDMQYDSSTKPGQHWAAYVEVDSAYSWNPGNYVAGISNAEIFGIESPLWTETIRSMDDIEYMCFPRLAGVAEIGWTNSANRNWQEYKWRLANHGSRMKALGIDFYRSSLVPWPQ